MNTSRNLFPGWKGWLSSIAPNSQDKNHPIKSSVVEYMPAVNAPITEAATMQKVLQISLEASQELTFVTFDLAVIFDNGCGNIRRQIDVSQIAKTLGRRYRCVMLYLVSMRSLAVTQQVVLLGKESSELLISFKKRRI
ncbi:hypothetical protein ElyMa_006898000 [Elysia marginata]|uniref:Uncharacterized protein n=1 Tax=Elysia marginata TaxID=1093978 RepID=A0AAV4JDD8_9GAST|nr:hypothetical protein ElyMa_006898000 [Elysia marginata]